MALRRKLRKAELRWRKNALSGLLGADELATVALEPEQGQVALAAGSRPQHFFRDKDGRRYLFKTAPDQLIAAELFASGLRARGGRACLPAGRRIVNLVDRGPTVGIVQPLIDHSGERLPLEPRRWSALQIETMLEEHPWEWVVGNLDSHVDQYVLVGPERLPFNIDWDHSLLDLDEPSPSRHDRRSAAVFPIRNLLYDDYVAGRLPLDFWGMAMQARRVSRISDAAIDALFDEHYLTLAAGGVVWADAERRRVREAVLTRKRTCGSVFDVFIEELRAERAAGARARGVPWRSARRLVSAARDAWQRFAIRVGHDRIVRPVLKAQREVLDAWYRLRRRVA